jgi:hypothetical protein
MSILGDDLLLKNLLTRQFPLLLSRKPIKAGPAE